MFRTGRFFRYSSRHSTSSVHRRALRPHAHRRVTYVFQAMDSPLYTIPVLLFERNNTSHPSITLSYARIEEREYETYKYPDIRIQAYRAIQGLVLSFISLPGLDPSMDPNLDPQPHPRDRSAYRHPKSHELSATRHAHETRLRHVCDTRDMKRPTPRARNHPKRIRPGTSRAIMPVLLGSDMSSLGATLLRGPWPSPSTLQASALWSDQTTVIYAIRRMG